MRNGEYPPRHPICREADLRHLQKVRWLHTANGDMLSALREDGKLGKLGRKTVTTDPAKRFRFAQQREPPTLPAAATALTILHVPGHTPESTWWRTHHTTSSVRPFSAV